MKFSHLKVHVISLYTTHLYTTHLYTTHLYTTHLYTTRLYTTHLYTTHLYNVVLLSAPKLPDDLTQFIVAETYTLENSTEERIRLKLEIPTEVI